MNDYIRFVIIVLLGASIGVALYRTISRTTFPVSSLIGMGSGGAAAGTLAGMVLVSVFRAEDVFWAAWGFPLVTALGCAIGMQTALENWTGDPFDG